MRPALASVLGLVAILGSANLVATPQSEVAVRRVSMSLSFSGDRVFMHGRIPVGATDALAVMEGPPPGQVRLMEKGRIGPFWLGVHQYRLDAAPGYYWLNLHCPSCNGLSHCEHAPDLDRINQLLAPYAVTVGPGAIHRYAQLERVSGSLASGEAQRVLDGFWELQARRGLYGVRDNAIRISADRSFYHAFRVPDQAPEGKYHITTYFLSPEAVVGTAENDLFVRKTGLVARLSRMADRNALGYGLFTIAIALGAGWLAGTLFRRGGGH